MMNTQLIFLIAILVSLAACEKQADLSKHKRHVGNGVSFLLPANWEVTQEVADRETISFSVESPGPAITQIIIYEQEVSFSLRDYAKYTIVNSENGLLGGRNEGTLKIIKKSFSGKTHNGYQNKFVWTVAAVLPTRYVTEFFKLPTKNKDVFIVTMTPEDNLDKVDKGFDLIISSFKQQ